jgi:hypothetical protein
VLLTLAEARRTIEKTWREDYNAGRRANRSTT